MVKKTIETYECDICGATAERYTIGFPDGLLALDRCEKHDRKITSLRDERGGWTPMSGGRGSFKVSSPEDIERQRGLK